MVGVPGVFGVGSTGTFCADSPRKQREAVAADTTKMRKRMGALMVMFPQALCRGRFLQQQGC